MSLFLHCTPMAGNWDLSLKPQCYSMKLFVVFGLINTSFNITTDVLFAMFPIFIIWPLKMKRRLRIYLICILSLGYLYASSPHHFSCGCLLTLSQRRRNGCCQGHLPNRLHQGAGLDLSREHHFLRFVSTTRLDPGSSRLTPSIVSSSILASLPHAP